MSSAKVLAFPDGKATDKLSVAVSDAILAVAIRQIETNHDCSTPEGMCENLARLSSECQAIHYYFGEALVQYRDALRSAKAWTAVLRAIAFNRGISERTMFRIIKEYEIAAKAPKPVVYAVLRSGVDPARKRNHKLLTDLSSSEADDSAATIGETIEQHRAVKKTACAAKKQLDGIEKLAIRMYQMADKEIGALPLKNRTESARYLVEYVNAALRTDVETIRQYSRPTAVPLPRKKAVKE